MDPDYETIYREALRITSELEDGDVNYIEALFRFDRCAQAYKEHYHDSSDDEDLTLACFLAMAAERLTPQDYCDSILFQRQVSLSEIFDIRYEKTGEAVYLQASIDSNRQALAISTSEHTYPTKVMLFRRLIRKYQKTGGIDDLSSAIKEGQDIVNPGLDCSDQVRLCTDLASLLAMRSRENGSSSDIEEAIELGLCAEKADERSPSERGFLIMNLSGFYHTKFTQNSSDGDLGFAISKARQAEKIIPAEDENRALILNNLSTILFDSYKQQGRCEDLEEAIKTGSEARSAAPSGSEILPVIYSNLARAHNGMYDETNAMRDLDEAIELSEKSLELFTTRKHSAQVAHAKAGLLNNLALYLKVRHNRKGASKDLDRAIDYARQAAKSFLRTSAEFARSNSNLATLLKEKYIRTHRNGEQDPGSHLESAICFARTALEASKESEKAGMSANLGNLLGLRYSVSNAVKDLEEATGLNESSVNQTPPDHPELGRRLLNLGDRLSQKDPASGEATCVYMKAWKCEFAPNLLRIKAARSASTILLKSRDFQRASEILDKAVELFSLVSPTSLEREDQEYVLTSFPQLAGDAASLSLKVGKSAFHAVGLLELGRGIILGQSIDLKNDVSKLELQDESSAKNFKKLRLKMNSPSESFKLEERRKTFGDLKQALKDIRKLTGFERFQLPPTVAELSTIARDGPIVILNATAISSDAIILKSTGPVARNLPNLKYRDVLEEKKALQKLLQEEDPSKVRENNMRLCSLLNWLWKTAVQPVLEFLEIQPAKETSDLPRIWWIGIGPMSLFPIHAARGFSGKNLMSYAISSYTPTIKALSFSRERPSKMFDTPPTKLLLVTMPTTPGNVALPGVDEEAEAIKKVKPFSLCVKEERHVNLVLEGLLSHDIVHFACHGASNPLDPSNSHLQLLHETNALKSANLSVSDISNITTRAELAYLSACCTANNDATYLIDEIIHMASGFQLAGFSHVIGTMWTVDDNTALNVARNFYSHLLDDQGGNGTMTLARKVSLALHTVLEAGEPEDPLAWAPFIHLGA